MALLSLADSCRLLAIDVKTLHRWLGLAHLSVQAHPLDARLKCVTREHIEHLAVTHHRALSASSELLFSAPSSASSASSEESQASVWSSVGSEVSGPISALTQQLCSLQAQVLTLQQQLALLTGQLQEELQWRTSRITLSAESSPDKSAESSPDKSAESSPDKSAKSSPDKSAESSPDKSAKPSPDKSAESSSDKSAKSSPDKSAKSSPDKSAESVPASIDRRKHPRVLPLVEYGAQGNYVVISPEEGLLSFELDSPEWFAWLSTLPSFRFVGKGGHFTAFRGYQSTAHTSWWAHRQIHSHSQRRRLGLTTSVTIECLELAASSLQALVS
jgi:hypothetical protein